MCASALGVRGRDLIRPRGSGKVLIERWGHGSVGSAAKKAARGYWRCLGKRRGSLFVPSVRRREKSFMARRIA